MKPSGVKPLFNAVFRRDSGEVERLLNLGLDPNLVDSDGRTPLIQASIDGNKEIIAILLQKGARADVRDKRQSSALHYAAQGQHVPSVELLLSAGAEIDVQDENGNTPLSNAVFTSKGRPEVIRLLSKHGANKNLQNYHGVSPLKLAQSIANYPIAPLLD